MNKILDIVKAMAITQRWPLTRLDIRAVRDNEVQGWEYVAVVLVFACQFDVADALIHQLYGRLDQFSAELNDEENSILTRTLFFDIDTNVSAN